jgi:hypothetical protein
VRTAGLFRCLLLRAAASRAPRYCWTTACIVLQTPCHVQCMVMVVSQCNDSSLPPVLLLLLLLPPYAVAGCAPARVVRRRLR